MRRTTPPRIVIHGVGQVGSLIAKIALIKGFPIVAAFNRAGAKVGKDLGRLIGLDQDLGVIVQDSKSSYCSDLNADIVLFGASDFLEANFPAYENYMRPGMNVLYHGGESYFHSART